MKALTTLVFVNRYIAGIALRLLKGRKFDETRDDFEPTVEVIIPMFNEGGSIEETLVSLLAQDYPAEKLRVTVVDDCSTDDSYEHAARIALTSRGRIRVSKNPRNIGKRHSIIRATRESQAEIIVSVDSDVVVDPPAIRQLMRRFVSPQIAAVGGRIDVRNMRDNWLTRMQVVKYWYAYSFLKNLEWAFRRVMCLSGCLTAYRRTVLVELEPVLMNREILGVPIKYGEDRFLTRKIVAAGYHTTMTNDAVCRTFVPTTLAGYFSQQLRWRRSNIVDYVGGMSHVWRLNPIIAIHFFSLFGLLVAYPALIARSIMRGTFLPLLVSHIIGAFGFGLIYRWYVRKERAELRVSALAFGPLALVLPIIYAWLTPVAFFTLDSSSWETRGHGGTDEEDETEGSGEGDNDSGEVTALPKPPQPQPAFGLAAREVTASASRSGGMPAHALIRQNSQID
jgi:cellulose synthase/poly-beta-1,6-N-acetylglucosamine synthase-like glycosyltransferase